MAGIGGRVLMRVSAVLAGPVSTGMRTDNGNIVGEITVPGTIALVAFAGVANGLIGGLVYAALRPWLAPLGRRGAVGFGVLLLAALGFVVITPENPDFRRFGPAALNIAMFALIYVLFGASLVSLHAALDRVTPGRPSGRPTGIGGIALAIASGLAGLLSLFVLTTLVITTVMTLAGTAAPGTGFGLANSLVTIGLIGAGLFVRFGDVFEGFLPSRQLGGDYFEANTLGTALVGRRGRTHRLGDPIDVLVAKIDRGEGKVELAPAQDSPGIPPKGKGPSPVRPYR